MSPRHDVLVLGAGHNGLVSAAYLAKAGLNVCVLERRDRIGGATLTEEAFPGYRYSVFSYLVSLLRPEVIAELELPRHGLQIVPTESTLNPLPGGDCLYREADSQRTYHHLRRHSPRDAEAYPEYKVAMHHMAHLMRRLQLEVPPEVRRELSGESDVQALAELGRFFLSLPAERFDTLLQMLTQSADEFLSQWFESDAFKAALATSSIIGSFVSPRSPGSAYVLLHHYMGEVDGVYRSWGFQKGGTGGVAAAVASAARSFGAEIRLEAPVTEIVVEGGRARGVLLEGGEVITAETVVSSLAPQLSLDRLLPSGVLPEEMGERVRRWNSEGCSAKVNLALDGLPSFACMPEPGAQLAGGVSWAPSLDYVEEAFDEAKAGRPSRRPFVDLVFPSVLDPEMAPPGKHVLSCFCQYVPYSLDAAGWESERERFGDAVLDVLEEAMPNLRSLVLHRQVLGPRDIESIVGIPGGNIFHGELRLGQLFALRPDALASDFTTPIDDYYLCGSSSHPGGGISGGPGRGAALRILADRAREVGT